MEKANSLFAFFGRNWGIDKNELVKEFTTEEHGGNTEEEKS
jgi:hypothetical protein